MLLLTLHGLNTKMKALPDTKEVIPFQKLTAIIHLIYVTLVFKLQVWTNFSMGKGMPPCNPFPGPQVGGCLLPIDPFPGPQHPPL